MSEQPRSVPPQNLANTLGRNRRRSRRPLPAPSALDHSPTASPEPVVPEQVADESPAEARRALSLVEDAPSKADKHGAPGISHVADQVVTSVPAGGPKFGESEAFKNQGAGGEWSQDSPGESAAQKDDLANSASPGTGDVSKEDPGEDVTTKHEQVAAAPDPARDLTADPASEPASEPGVEPATEPSDDLGAEVDVQAPRSSRSTSSRSTSARKSPGRPRSRRADKGAKPVGRPKSAAAAPGEDHLPAATGVYVPVDVRDLVSARRRQADPAPTTAEVVLRAIESVYADLPRLVAEALAPEMGELFTFSAPARTHEVKVQMGMRLTKGQLRALDQVEQRVGATSRGQLVTLAVRAALTQS